MRSPTSSLDTVDPTAETPGALTVDTSAHMASAAGAGSRLEGSCSPVAQTADITTPPCPQCASMRAKRCGRRAGAQRLRCRECGRYFTELTGTILEGLHRRELWPGFCILMIRGLTLVQITQRLGISKNTAFAWRHRVTRVLSETDSEIELRGQVGLGQRNIVRSFKGSVVPPDAQWTVEQAQYAKMYMPAITSRLPRSRRASLLFAVSDTGRLRAAVLSPNHDGGFSDAMRRLTEADADLIVTRGFGIWPANNDSSVRLTWVSQQRNRQCRMDRYADDPESAPKAALKLLLNFAHWIRHFHGVATKYLLQYVAWFWRVHTLSHLDPKSAARTLFAEVTSPRQRVTSRQVV
ncbi:MAG: hypothetical protein VB144_07775 [Clostridia bacterium]|nr:hypothetical protein [Clostridia bacterium]